MAETVVGGTGGEHTPKCFVIVYNVSKRHNIGTLARSCSAFGVAKMCLVGSRQYNAFGAHGADDHVSFCHFPSLEECCRRLKEQEGCRIIGVEITDEAQPVQSHPFSGPTAFMLGNEGSGLSRNQIALCDSFVYIPQYGAGTASLNVTVAATIVLQHFALWAGYREHQRQDAKFIVAERPQRNCSRGVVPRTEAEEAAERLRRQQQRQPNSSMLDELSGDEAESGDEDGGGGGGGALALFD